MRRLPTAAFILLLPFTAYLMTGCGGGKKGATSTTEAASGTEGETGGEGGERTELASKGWGTLQGKVVLDGDLPDYKPLKEFATHKEGPKCHEGGTLEEEIPQQWIVNKENKGVQYAVVFLKPPSGKYFKVKAEDKDRKKEKIILRQPHCAFVPHVFALYPSYFDGTGQKATGQTFAVTNDAKFNHNTEYHGEALKNPGGNMIMPPGDTKQLKIKLQEGPVNFKCDIHPWMNARCWTFDHPYYAVTDQDGKFAIKNVPAGVEVKVVTWHEAPGAEGTYYPSQEGQAVTVMDGETKTLPDVHLKRK